MTTRNKSYTNEELRIELFQKSVQLAFAKGGIPAALEEASKLYQELLYENEVLDTNLAYMEEILPTNVMTPTLQYDSFPETWQIGFEEPATINTLIGITIVFNNLQNREIRKVEVTYNADFPTAVDEILEKLAEVLKREPIEIDMAKMTIPGLTIEDVLNITKRLTLYRCFETEDYNEKRLEIFNEYADTITETNHFGTKYDKARKKARKHFNNTINRVFENSEKRLRAKNSGIQNPVPPQLLE